MIDPFGVAGAPMELVGRILQNPKSEVYVTFMSREMNRFLRHPSFEPHLDDFFGCRDWRLVQPETDSDRRRQILFELYENQLKANGAAHVLRFGVYEGR